MSHIFGKVRLPFFLSIGFKHSLHFNISYPIFNLSRHSTPVTLPLCSQFASVFVRLICNCIRDPALLWWHIRLWVQGIVLPGSSINNQPLVQKFCFYEIPESLFICQVRFCIAGAKVSFWNGNRINNISNSAVTRIHGQWQEDHIENYHLFTLFLFHTEPKEGRIPAVKMKQG